MSTAAALIAEALAASKIAGKDQRTLAALAGCAPETLSRAKKRGDMELSTLVAICDAGAMKICLMPAQMQQRQPIERRSSLADPRWGLAWSNPDAPSDLLVRKALAKGSFLVILEAVLEHGLEFVRGQWRLMLGDDERPSAQAQKNVERMLGNIEKGIALAQA